MIENIDSDQAIMAASVPGVKGTGITLTLPKGSLDGQETDLVYELPKTNKITVSIIEQWCGFVRQQNERKADKAIEAAARRRTAEALASREVTDSPIFTGTPRTGEDSRKEPEEAIQETRAGGVELDPEGQFRKRLSIVSKSLDNFDGVVTKLRQEKAAIEAALSIYDTEGVYDNDRVQPVSGVLRSSTVKEGARPKRAGAGKARVRKPTTKEEA